MAGPVFRGEHCEGPVAFVDTSEISSQVKAARVLVVDDDPAMQRMIVGYLTEHNLRATAVSGRQGLIHALVAREPEAESTALSVKSSVPVRS